MLRTAIFNDGENFRHTIRGLFEGPPGSRRDSGAPVFNRGDYLPKGADWTGFFRHLVDESRVAGVDSRLVRAYWYVVGAVDFRPQLPKTEWDPESRGRRHFPPRLDEWHARHAKSIQGFVRDMAELRRPRRFSAKRDGVGEIVEELRARRDIKEREFGGQVVLQRAIVRKHRAIQFRRSGAIRYNLFTKEYGQEKTTDVNLAVDMVLLRDAYDIAVIVSGDQDFVPAAEAAKSMGKTVVNVAFKTKGGKLLPGGAQRLNEAVDWCVEVGYDDFRRFMFPERRGAAPSGEAGN